MDTTQPDMLHSMNVPDSEDSESKKRVKKVYFKISFLHYHFLKMALASRMPCKSILMAHFTIIGKISNETFWIILRVFQSGGFTHTILNTTPTKNESSY